MLWLDDYAVRPPVNKVYFPLTQPVKRFFRSTLTWLGKLAFSLIIPVGFIVCVWLWCAVIAAIGYAINYGTGVVR